MNVIDASVFVSYLVPQDVNHAASRAWLQTQLTASNRLIAPIIMLTEVGGAIARRTGQTHLGQQAVNQIQQIPLLRLVAIDHSLGLRATQLAINLRLRGADAIYVAVADSLGIPLVSLDKEHQNRAGVQVIVVVP